MEYTRRWEPIVLQPIKNAVQGVMHAAGYHLAPHRPYSRGGVADVKICSWDERGIPVSFLVVDEIDNVQAEHLQRRFYAPEELALIGSVFPRGGVFFDLGANVGNHTVYAARILSASKVIAVEPNPIAYRILRANIGLNGLLETVSHHALGVSNRHGRATMETPGHNLGGTQLIASSSGSVTLASGDDILCGAKVDFIKIDIQGMEIEALDGLSRTIGTHRPALFVEVAVSRAVDFDRILRTHKYTVTHRGPAGPGWENILAQSD